MQRKTYLFSLLDALSNLEASFFRPYELIAVSTFKEIAIWHVGSNPDPDGRLSVEKVATLSTHDSEVPSATLFSLAVPL